MTTINAVAQLIADIDPALARVFVSSPFQRHNIVTAFHGALLKSKYAVLADRIAVQLRQAIDHENITA